MRRLTTINMHQHEQRADKRIGCAAPVSCCHRRGPIDAGTPDLGKLSKNGSCGCPMCAGLRICARHAQHITSGDLVHCVAQAAKCFLHARHQMFVKSGQMGWSNGATVDDNMLSIPPTCNKVDEKVGWVRDEQGTGIVDA